jgi:hypothetical protein
MKRLKAMISMAGGQTTVMPETVVEAIKEGASDYTDAFTFETTETIGGLTCDRYAYSLTTGGPHPTAVEGLMWLSPRVPFGVVKQTGTVTDTDGGFVSSYEQTTIDSGNGAQGDENLIAQITSAVPRTGTAAQAGEDTRPRFATSSLPEAYDSGAIRLLVAVDPTSGGRRLGISIVNSSSEPLRLSIATDEYALRADSPVNTLTIAASESHDLDLQPGESSPAIAFRQLGDRGVVDGEFSLVVYDGTPLYSGSVTIDSLSHLDDPLRPSLGGEAEQFD